MATSMRPYIRDIFGCMLFLLLTFPIFFDIYRGAAFNIVPHDDYVPYLLYLLGEEGGKSAADPFGYRIFSVALAIPLYFVLPVYTFTYLPQIETTYLRALEALSMVSYLAMVMASGIMFNIVRKKMRGTVCYAIIAALITFLLFRFTAIYGVDSIAIMLICLLMYCMDAPLCFSCLLLCSAGFNEKIVFIFAMLLLSRAIARKQPFNAQLICSIAAVAAYFTVRWLIPLPGSNTQWGFLNEPLSVLHELALSLSLKGLILNIVPILLVLIFYICAAAENTLCCREESIYFSYSDIIPLLGIILIALMVEVKYNIGRIAMYCFPLYLPFAAKYLERIGHQYETRR